MQLSNTKIPACFDEMSLSSKNKNNNLLGHLYVDNFASDQHVHNVRNLSQLHSLSKSHTPYIFNTF